MNGMHDHRQERAPLFLYKQLLWAFGFCFAAFGPHGLQCSRSFPEADHHGQRLRGGRAVARYRGHVLGRDGPPVRAQALRVPPPLLLHPLVQQRSRVPLVGVRLLSRAGHHVTRAAIGCDTTGSALGLCCGDGTDVGSRHRGRSPHGLLRASGHPSSLVAHACFRRGGEVWHNAWVSNCLPLAAPIRLSPLHIPTLCGSERVLVVSTEPPDDLSCLTTPGVGRPGDGAVARAVDRGHPDAHPESVWGFAASSTDLCMLGCASAGSCS